MDTVGQIVDRIKKEQIKELCTALDKAILCAETLAQNLADQEAMDTGVDVTLPELDNARITLDKYENI